VKDIRNGKKAPSRTKHNFMFRKLIKCGECGGTITAELQKGTVYYHCSHYNDCKQKLYTSEDKIEEALVGVFRFFENLTVDEAGIIKEKIRENHSQEIEYKEKLLRSLEERYRALQRRLDALYDDRLDGVITQEFWKIKNTEIINEQEEVVRQINRAKDSEAKYFEYWLNILDLASRASEIYNKRNNEEKRMLLNFIFSNLILKDGKLTYKLNQPMKILSKRIQEKIDYENSFEPRKSVVNKRQKGSLEPICPALLPG
ncbi:MAG: zinc ribbon domain-containing protein, partial [Candidatus Omnitrophica bacterium]|nr:zinc ribbon domain-containing protein [Candidatus Omnitrophota bacterium]